jgi:hypothetical protein
VADFIDDDDDTLASTWFLHGKLKENMRVG